MFGTLAPYNAKTGQPVKGDDRLQFNELDLVGSNFFQVADGGSTIEGPLCYLYD